MNCAKIAYDIFSSYGDIVDSIRMDLATESVYVSLKGERNVLVFDGANQLDHRCIDSSIRNRLVGIRKFDELQ